MGGEESGGMSIIGHIPEGDGVLMGLLLLAGGVVSAEMREWKTADGSRRIVAEYVRSGGGEVTILRERDRRIFTLSLEKLSAEDRAWVKAREADGPAAGDDQPREADEEFA